VSSDGAVIEAHNVFKVFVARGDRGGRRAFLALRDVNLLIEPGQFVSFVGPSGCGKSTLLNMVAGLVRPTEGVVRYKGAPIAAVNTKVGYITQDDNLLPWRTLRENVEVALEFRGVPAGRRREQAARYIALVGLAGLVVWGRFLILFVQGEGEGHVQSVVLGAMLFVVAVQLAALGVIGDLLAANRVLMQRTLERTRRIELKVGVEPSHYEPGATPDETRTFLPAAEEAEPEAATGLREATAAGEPPQRSG
jgi:hypothetical protein